MPEEDKPLSETCKHEEGSPGKYCPTCGVRVPDEKEDARSTIKEAVREVLGEFGFSPKPTTTPKKKETLLDAITRKKGGK